MRRGFKPYERAWLITAHFVSNVHSSSPVKGIPFQVSQASNCWLLQCSTSTIRPFCQQIGNGRMQRASRRSNVRKPLFTAFPRSFVLLIVFLILSFVWPGKVPVVVLLLHVCRHVRYVASVHKPEPYHVAHRQITVDSQLFVLTKPPYMFLLLKSGYFGLWSRFIVPKQFRKGNCLGIVWSCFYWFILPFWLRLTCSLVASLGCTKGLDSPWGAAICGA